MPDAAKVRGRILAGAVNDLKVVLNYSDDGLTIDNVNKDPLSGLVTVTFSPTSEEPPVVVVSGIGGGRVPFVSHITKTSFIIGGSEIFHFIAILRKK